MLVSGVIADGFWCREALDEFAEIKEREEKEAALKREKKKKDYQARKMHYLLSTKQVGLPEPDSSRKPLGPWPDRDKLAAWMGHDLLKDIAKTQLEVQFHAAAQAHAGTLSPLGQRPPRVHCPELGTGSESAAHCPTGITQHGGRSLALQTGSAGAPCVAS